MNATLIDGVFGPRRQPELWDIQRATRCAGDCLKPVLRWPLSREGPSAIAAVTGVAGYSVAA